MREWFWVYVYCRAMHHAPPRIKVRMYRWMMFESKSYQRALDDYEARTGRTVVRFG